MRYAKGVSSYEEIRTYIRDYGHRGCVELRVLAADGINAAWGMSAELEEFLAKREDGAPAWTVQGRDQLDAAATLRYPLLFAMESAVRLLQRIAGGFQFGPAVTLAHGALPLPHGPGGMDIDFHVFEDHHRFEFGIAQGGGELARAYGHGGFRSTIARVLLLRSSDGLTFADEAEAVDAEGRLETFVDLARALRRTECTPLRRHATELADRVIYVRGLVLGLGDDFDELRHLSRRRSRRSCRTQAGASWVSYFDESFRKLQEERLAVVKELHSLGVAMRRFVNQPIVFPQRIVFPRPSVV